MQFVGQLKKRDANGSSTDAGDNTQSIFVLTIAKEIQQTRQERSVTVL